MVACREYSFGLRACAISSACFGLFTGISVFVLKNSDILGVKTLENRTFLPKSPSPRGSQLKSQLDQLTFRVKTVVRIPHRALPSEREHRRWCQPTAGREFLRQNSIEEQRQCFDTLSSHSCRRGPQRTVAPVAAGPRHIAAQSHFDQR